MLLPQSLKNLWTAKPAEGRNAAPKLQHLTSIDGVYIPPKGGGEMKFSFANPEPSIDFAGFLFAFEVISFENIYGIDPEKTVLKKTGRGVEVVSSRLTWAGGQQYEKGGVRAHIFLSAENYIEWQVDAELPNGSPVKSIKTIVRGLPRGKLSVSAGNWQDPGDDEKIYEYPALLMGMGTPLVAIQEKGGDIWSMSALQREVRPARFGLFPGPSGYKAELIYEQAGWQPSSRVKTCPWRIVGPRKSWDEVASIHFEEVSHNWSWCPFERRKDVPQWMKKIALAVTLHGEHWTGFVHNDFRQQTEILRWIATQIDPSNVMVFLAGWDGRYYWSYPTFEIGSRPGGVDAFSELIDVGHALGFHFALMFSSNVANPANPEFESVSDARLRALYGDPFPGDYVDWDGDRKGEGSMVFMNLAVSSWRDLLCEKIGRMIEAHKVDAYFLDICGLWENNLDGDMFLGLKEMIETLADRFPGVPPIAEMQYDAQMGIIPMNQVARFSMFAQANYGTVASFRHLSWPAPGKGSTGIHEFGFGRYQPVNSRQDPIPTISFAYDTFSAHSDAVASDIATAKARFSQSLRNL